MSRQKILSLCATLILLSVLACAPIRTRTATPATPIHTPTVNPYPTATATQPPELAGPLRQVTSLAGLLPYPFGDLQVRALADNSVWIIQSQAIMHWNGQDWESVLSDNERVLAAVDDGDGLWVLRQGGSGIAAWKDGNWTTYGAESGWADPSTNETSWWAPTPWSVSSGAAGMLWFPMGSDVRAYDGERWSLYTLEDMGFSLPEWEELEIVLLLAMRAGGSELWVGECYYSGPGPMGGEGVRWFDGKTWHGADAPVGRACISAMDVDPAGNVWLGSNDIVWRYEPATQTWTSYSLPEALLSGYNFARSILLIADRAGDVWITMQLCGGASCSGPSNLYRIHAGEWSLVFAGQDFSASPQQLVLDGSGQGWSFWEGSIYRLEPGSMEPVASLEVRSADVSHDGSIWVVAGYEEEAALWILEP